MAQGGGILPPGADGIAIYSHYRNILEHRGSIFYDSKIKTAHAIVRYSLGAEERGTFYKVNESKKRGGRHVEHIVTEHLEKKLGAGSKETKEKMEVYMYMNFSPCDYQDGNVLSCCCTKLIKFTKDHPGIDLHVRFVGLYNINRQSCRDKNCTHLQGFSVKEAVSNKNEEGLRKLVRAGIDVAVFTQDDWRFVHDILCQGMPPEDSQANTPQKDSQADTPQKGSQADTPQKGSQADTPQKGSQADTPQKGSQADTPQKGSQADTPQKDSQANTPQKDSQADTQQASSDGNKLEEGMKNMTLGKICKICKKNLGERVEDKKMKEDLEHIVSPSQGTGGE